METAKPKIIKFKQLALAYLVPLGLLLILLVVFSPLSPIYKYNYEQSDFNVTMSVAKAIGHGQVYMRDIFEQRGIYLYFLHLFVLIKPYSLAKTAMFFVQIINFLLLWLLMRRIGIKFGDATKNKQVFYGWASSLMLTLVIIMPSFIMTMSPEEVSMIGVLYAMNLLFTYQKEHQITLKQSFIGGLLIGFILNIKYNQLMALAGFFLFYGLRLLFNKQIKQFAKVAGTAIFGFLLANIPMLIYFGVNHSLGDYLYQYFLRSASSINLVHTIASLALYLNILGIILIAFAPSLYYSIASFKHDKLAISTTIGMQILGVILIGRSALNYLPPLIIILASLIIVKLKTGFNFYKIYTPKWQRIGILTFQVIVLLGFTLETLSDPIGKSSINFQPFNYAKDNQELAEVKAAKMIDEYPTKNTKILSYNNVTNMTYLYNNQYPRLKYFDQVAIPYSRLPEAPTAQYNYIKSKYATWVEFSSQCIIKPKQMPKKTWTNKVNKIDKSRHSDNKYSPATVSGAYNFERKYPSRMLEREYVYHGKNRDYILAIRVPKALFKNYKLVYLGIHPLATNSKSLKLVYVNQFLFVNNKLLKKYPELNIKHKRIIKHLTEAKFD